MAGRAAKGKSTGLYDRWAQKAKTRIGAPGEAEDARASSRARDVQDRCWPGKGFTCQRLALVCMQCCRGTGSCLGRSLHMLAYSRPLVCHQIWIRPVPSIY